MRKQTILHNASGKHDGVILTMTEDEYILFRKVLVQNNETVQQFAKAYYRPNWGVITRDGVSLRKH